MEYEYGQSRKLRSVPALGFDAREEESTGTTLIAAEFDGGVIIGADSRTSAGSVVHNRVADKLTEVTPNVFVSRSGSAADTQAITDIVRYNVQVAAMVEGVKPTVYRVAQVFRQYCYEYRDSLSAGLLVTGWDEQLGGQIYAIPLGGYVVRQPCASGGSGSVYVTGYIDSQWQPKMAQDDCERLVKEAVALAIKRDGSSGGVCRLGILTKDGMQRKLFKPDALPSFDAIRTIP